MTAALAGAPHLAMSHLARFSVIRLATLRMPKAAAVAPGTGDGQEAAVAKEPDSPINTKFSLQEALKSNQTSTYEGWFFWLLQS